MSPVVLSYFSIGISFDKRTELEPQRIGGIAPTTNYYVLERRDAVKRMRSEEVTHRRLYVGYRWTAGKLVRVVY